MSSYFRKKNESFTVTFPFLKNDEVPQIIVAKDFDDYSEILKKIPEDKIEYQSVKFRRPGFGLDCQIKELSFVSSGHERILSEEKLKLNRIKYLLIGTSFLGEDSLILSKDGQYEILAPISEEQIHNIDPNILNYFLILASKVWDQGINVQNLLTKEDYEILRLEENAKDKILLAKGLITQEDLDRSLEQKKTS